MLKISIKNAVFILLSIVLYGCSQYAKPITLERVAAVGASVTAGWGVQTPPIKGDFGGYRINLKHIIDAMILTPHEEVAYFGHPMFFSRPVEYGSELIEDVSSHEPTLIVAVDYLFWFAYGNAGSEGEDYRMKKFKKGLSILDNVRFPLIVGDIPDVRNSIGRVLSASQVPEVNTIQKMNSQLRTWAAMHPNVTVLGVHQLYKTLLEDRSISTSSYTWPAGSRSKLLQNDLLHTTLEGTVAACLVVADTLAFEGVETNPKVLMVKAAENARAAAKK